MKNLAARQVGKYGMTEQQLAEVAYQVYDNGAGWTWYVLKMYQADDSKPYARWFCYVFSPMCPRGELGDVYVADVKRGAYRIRNRMIDIAREAVAA